MRAEGLNHCWFQVYPDYGKGLSPLEKYRSLLCSANANILNPIPHADEEENSTQHLTPDRLCIKGWGQLEIQGEMQESELAGKILCAAFDSSCSEMATFHTVCKCTIRTQLVEGRRWMEGAAFTAETVARRRAIHFAA